LSCVGLSGARVILPYRGDEFEYRSIKPAFELGQVRVVSVVFLFLTAAQFTPLPFHPRDYNSIQAAISDADIVVNLIGKFYETKHLVPTRKADGKLSRVNYNYDDVHFTIAESIAKASKQAGIKTLVHVSSLSASDLSASHWSRSKFSGEEAVRRAFPDAVCAFSL
jgi:NADH dehydrogenase (ubiquinone) 1 alpha subcomplex subunit 9